MGKLENKDESLYRVVLLKVIDSSAPVYYRLVRLSDYTTIDVSANKIMDEIFNGVHIENMRCSNNLLYITDANGYDSTDEIIVIDEFDQKRPNAFDWSMMKGEKGRKLISMFSTEKNKKSLGQYEIDCHSDIAWECPHGHLFYAGFSTMYGLGIKCPMCEAISFKKTMSLKYWARLTKNYDILQAYELGSNERRSNNIAWNSKKEVEFLILGTNRNTGDAEQRLFKASLRDITTGKRELPTKDLDETNDYIKQNKNSIEDIKGTTKTNMGKGKDKTKSV